MSEPPSDKALLSMPPHTTSEPPTGTTPISSSRLQTKTRHPSQPFFVAPPVLPSAEKSQYKELPDRFKHGVDFDENVLDEVIGEYIIDGNLFYFVLFKGGMVHRFLARAFKAKFGNFVNDYEQKREAGTLSSFDPSSQNVHPDSRVKLSVNLSKRPAHKALTLDEKTVSEDEGDNEEVSDSEDEAENDDEDYEDTQTHALRRSSRTATIGSRKKAVKNLPFSPRRRTRSSKVYADGDSEDDLPGFDQESSEIPARRSTRTRKNAKANLADSEDEGDEESNNTSAQRAEKPNWEPTKRKVVRGKASRPAYGNIRVVADLDYDPHSDDETLPLRAHREECEKCHRRPAHILLEAMRNRPKGRGRRKKMSDDEDVEGNEEEKLIALGGWVRCVKCPVSAHWKCLAATQRDEILKAARDRDRAIWRETHPSISEPPAEEGQARRPHKDEPKKRAGLDAYQTTEFICGSCMKGGSCMHCMGVALEPDPSLVLKAPSAHNAVKEVDIVMEGDTEPVVTASTTPPADGKTTSDSSPCELLFRCVTCRRLAHYAHLPDPNGDGAHSVQLAVYYQKSNGWQCADCVSFIYGLDKILAWRPYPPGAVEPPRPLDEAPNVKSHLPREYLVKWTDRSYRRTQWVPHLWLATTHQSALKNFLVSGPKVELLLEPPPLDGEMEVDGEGEIATEPTFEIGAGGSRESSTKPDKKTAVPPSDSSPDAERKIPPAWKTVDRVLDVVLWYPQKRAARKRKQKVARGKGKGKGRVVSDSDEGLDVNDSDIEHEHAAAFADGEQPSEDLTENLEEWQARTGKTFGMTEISLVVWAFFKWGDLGYEEATWDSPPSPDESGFKAFETAFRRFLVSRTVVVRRRSEKDNAMFDKRPKDEYKRKYALKEGQQPDLGQNSQFKLMPFQVDGFNWLCNNWWNLQHCILADEMGLGKTVQISTFLGHVIEKSKAWPALVIVPNSTITNWVRELARWAPNLRVVPFYGEGKARDVVREFELNHARVENGTTGAKFHVLVTTYDTLVNPKDLTAVFKRTPRWEVLVVDEGQRLKNDNSLLFKRLNELNTVHRIIMTGTPLNNNIRELFNLMNFLDPEEWRDLEALEKEYAELTEDLVKQLHNKLKPYFLRRTKSEVLQLPPKNEVIVPVSMTPLQKNVYRSILSKNVDILKMLTAESRSLISAAGGKSSMNNVLMQLRKCLQHPYLFDRDIEPKGMSLQEAHEKLIDGSSKLRLLKVLLPKLQARGHRVLLFSQFVINLDIVEDFLNGEGYKYLRLDGETKQAERQKGMDEFNRPDSDILIYLLSTRAGGVGINLWSADTVIIYDPDFNPHQDLQAIARSHRYGQQKTCLVFKLMVKDSAEERIMQTGKKKLVLDHLIVQKMDDQDSAGEDLQSILTFGAKALFEDEQNAKEIAYTDHDIEKLIEKTEKEGDQTEAPKEGGLSFSFAKVWAADKDSLEEIEDTPLENNQQGDSWAQALQLIELERQKEKAQEITGRGARRRAAALFPQQNLDFDDSPDKSRAKKKRNSNSKSVESDESDAYSGSSPIGSDDDDVDDTTFLSKEELKALSSKSAEATGATGPASKRRPSPPSSLEPSSSVIRYRVRQENAPLSPIHNHASHNGVDSDWHHCGLCGNRHGAGKCYMTDSSDNLVEYRYLLLVHGGEEPFEDRKAAINAIDEALYKRGKIHLIAGQPLNLIDQPASGLPPKKIQRVGQASRSAINDQQSGTDPVDLPARLSPPPNAGPSKRPPSPLLDDGLKKKTKISSSTACVVCRKTPHHLIKDCPVVLEGPKSVSKEIKRLDTDAAMTGTVSVLRKILSKQKKQELLARSASSDRSERDIIMVSD